jgi:2-polyprenyl-3-methyl-5-hydroxy-6-metoxy-1,4-benzoquinol methylase
MEPKNIYEDVRCCVCGNTDEKQFSIKYVKDGIDVIQCAKCSFVFIPPYYRKTITYSNYKDERVAEQIKKGNNWLKVQRHLLRYKLIQKYKKSGKLFDLGVGWGHFLLAGKQLGYYVSGIEISEQPYLYAKNTLGLPVEHIDFFKMAEDKKYDVLTMWDVLEHIDKADTVIEKSSRLINKGGFIFILIPQIDSYIAKKYGSDWKMMGLDHVNYFSKKTITELLEKNDFKVREIRSSFEIKLFIMYTLFSFVNKKQAKVAPQGPVINPVDSGLAQKRQSFFNKLTNLPKWMLWIFIRIHNPIYNALSFFKIGDEMVVVAEKL